MEIHPGMDKLELLQQGQLRGGELLEILRHLETCDKCFLNLPPQNPEDVMNRLLKVDDDEDEDFKDEDDLIEDDENH